MHNGIQETSMNNKLQDWIDTSSPHSHGNGNTFDILDLSRYNSNYTGNNGNSAPFERRKCAQRPPTPAKSMLKSRKQKNNFGVSLRLSTMFNNSGL